jgi:hypothetical protein
VTDLGATEDLDLDDDDLGLDDPSQNGVEAGDDGLDLPAEAIDLGDDDDGPLTTPTFWMRWHDTVIKVDLDDFTALDFRRFRTTTGLDLYRAVVSGMLEGFAGALWLILRRTNRKLRYQDVAGKVRMSHVLDRPPADEEDDANPEA